MWHLKPHLSGEGGNRAEGCLDGCIEVPSSRKPWDDDDDDDDDAGVTRKKIATKNWGCLKKD